MTIEEAIRDYEGSYMLGEADGQNWANRARPNDLHSLALVKAEELGQVSIGGGLPAPWLVQQAKKYEKRDQRFHPKGYYEGFLTAVRKVRNQYAFASVIRPSRW